MLGKALSDSSDSTVSSPVRSSYGGLAPQAMRQSPHSHHGSNSHRSSRNAAVRDVEKQQVRNSRHTVSSRTKSNGYATTAGGPRDEINSILLESKAAKILVSPYRLQRILCSQTNSELVIFVNLQSIRLYNHPTLHPLRPPCTVTSATVPTMHQEYHIPPSGHWFPSTNIQDPTSLHLLARRRGRLQCASSSHDQPPLADHLFWRRHGCLGSCCFLVLQRHPW
jgi:hypothetical protein